MTRFILLPLALLLGLALCLHGTPARAQQTNNITGQHNA
jgi:K+-transporting ATPase A subunit